MSEFGKHKLTDALSPPKHEAVEDKGGKIMPEHKLEAEQVREAREDEEARNAEASNRDRMVKIGRGNQQAGRQGQ
ncbi:hypothetical protein ACYOEI_17215 [Singulisphaera rosea]